MVTAAIERRQPLAPGMARAPAWDMPGIMSLYTVPAHASGVKIIMPPMSSVTAARRPAAKPVSLRLHGCTLAAECGKLL